MKAIIYCRVSTKDQATMGYSLPAQESMCREYAARKELEIIKVFHEKGESAKTTNRTQLKKLLDYASKNRKTIDAVLVYKLDRLTRDIADYHDLIRFFCKLNIDVKSITEDLDNSPTGKFMKTVLAASAQWDNDVKSDRTKDGMRQATKNGRWCWRAPIGYKRLVEDEGKSRIIPSEESKYVVKAFELLGSGLYKQTEIAQCLKKMGCSKITKSLLNKILRNHLYAGLIKTKFFDEIVEATHKPLISKELYYSVQAILDGKKPSIVPRNRNHKDFPLRGFLRCPKCHTKLTGGWSKGRLGKKYAYYRCRQSKCSVNVNKDHLEGVFYAYLKTFQPNIDVLTLFEHIVRDVWKAEQSEQIKHRLATEKKLACLEEKRDKIEDLMIEGKIDEETYKRKIKEVRQEISEKQMDLSETTIKLNDIDSCLEYSKWFLANISNLWFNASVNVKQRVQTLLFPDKITYNQNGSFEPTVTALIFKQLAGKTPEEYNLATPTGFEPVLRA